MELYSLCMIRRTSHPDLRQVGAVKAGNGERKGGTIQIHSYCIAEVWKREAATAQGFAKRGFSRPMF